MSNKTVNKILLYLFLVAIIANIVISISPEEYINEFNNNNENCTYTPRMKFNYGTEISNIYFYKCCDPEKCITLPFDLTRQSFISDDYTKEFFKSEQAIRYAEEGKIADGYNYNMVFDLCTFFGEEQLNEQNVAIATDITYDNAKSIFKTKKIVNNVRRGIKFGKGIGAIPEFEAGVFVTSVSCDWAIKEENKALSQLARCYPFYFNIKSHIINYGLIDNYVYCNNLAVNIMTETKDQIIVQAHNLVLIIGKVLSCFWNLITGNWQADTGQTVLEIFDKSIPTLNKNNELLNSKEYLDSMSSAIERIHSKEKIIEDNLRLARATYDKIGSMKQSFLFIINLLYKPSFNYSSANEKMQLANDIIKQTNYDYKISKFNSAINESEKVYEPLYLAQNKYNEENCKSREVRTWPFILLIITIIGFWLIYKYVTNEDYKLILIIITIILFFTLLFILIFAYSNINKSCIIRTYITPINYTIETPYLVEQNYTYNESIYELKLIDKNHSFIEKPRVVSENGFACVDGFFNIQVHLFNRENYPININLEVNATIVGTNNNRTIEIVRNNLSVENNKIFGFKESISANSGEVYSEVNSKNAIINLLENEFTNYINLSSIITKTELRNITHFKNNTQFQYLINLSN